MSVHDVQPAVGSPSVPRPRPAEPDAGHGTSETGTSTSRPAHLPWPEPWRPSDGARPRTEYWDVTTATWRTRR